MSSLLVFAHENQQDEKIKKLHSDLATSLRYASSAQGIGPTPTAVNEIPQADKDVITKILAASGTIPAGSNIKLGAILFHTEVPSEPEAPKHTLLTLPPEMRNRIYRSALIEPQNILIREDKDTLHHRHPRPLQMKPPQTEPPLLSTCRQIRKEALDIYYQENTFSIHIESCEANYYFRWCRMSEARFHSNHDFNLEGGIQWLSLIHI